MSKRGFLTLALVVATAALTVPAQSQNPGNAPSGDEIGHVRYEDAHQFQPRWQAADDVDNGVRAILFQDEIATPTSTEEVDIVATATLSFRTSRSDQGSVRLDLTPVGGADAADIAMQPGPLPYMSPTSHSDTTTTFTWIRKGVPAAGASYSFQLETGVTDGKDRGHSAQASGSKVTVVVEMWPAD